MIRSGSDFFIRLLSRLISLDKAIEIRSSLQGLFRKCIPEDRCDEWFVKVPRSSLSVLSILSTRIYTLDETVRSRNFREYLGSLEDPEKKGYLGPVGCREEGSGEERRATKQTKRAAWLYGGQWESRARRHRDRISLCATGSAEREIGMGWERKREDRAKGKRYGETEGRCAGCRGEGKGREWDGEGPTRPYTLPTLRPSGSAAMERHYLQRSLW